LRMTKKCTSVAAHFDGLTDTPVLCGVHCPMQHVQGYSGSIWLLPSGDVVSCLDVYHTKVLLYHTMVLLVCLTKVRC
jgi:hypothetical protein